MFTRSTPSASKRPIDTKKFTINALPFQDIVDHAGGRKQRVLSVPLPDIEEVVQELAFESAQGNRRSQRLLNELYQEFDVEVADNIQDVPTDRRINGAQQMMLNPRAPPSLPMKMMQWPQTRRSMRRR